MCVFFCITRRIHRICLVMLLGIFLTFDLTSYWPETITEVVLGTDHRIAKGQVVLHCSKGWTLWTLLLWNDFANSSSFCTHTGLSAWPAQKRQIQRNSLETQDSDWAQTQDIVSYPVTASKQLHTVAWNSLLCHFSYSLSCQRVATLFFTTGCQSAHLPLLTLIAMCFKQLLLCVVM